MSLCGHQTQTLAECGQNALVNLDGSKNFLKIEKIREIANKMKTENMKVDIDSNHEYRFKTNASQTPDFKF